MGALRILVIGCGSIGRRHIRLLREMGVEVVAYDCDRSAQESAVKQFGAIDWLTLPGAAEMDTIDVMNCYTRCIGAIVATPPDTHWASWYSAVRKATLPILIEKPLAVKLEYAVEMVETTREMNIPLLVGYNLRFHPGLRRVKALLDKGSIGKPLHAGIWCGSYLPDWRPGTDYRQGYAARRETGGGVLLDCSHEIDYACWLFGEPVSVSCTTQNTGALEIETEDVADLTVVFASGAQANIHLDYVHHRYSRGCVIVGDKGTLTMGLHPDQWSVSICYQEGIDFPRRCGDSSADNMYRAELQHFLAVIRSEEQPLCTGEDGLRALKVALAARESAETGRVVTL